MFLLIPFIWGLIEALFFPIAADVCLSYLAFFSLEKGLIGSLAVVFGALIGGGFMYRLGRENPSLGLKIATWLPGVFPNMLDYVESSLEKQELWALFLGSLKGIPYKTYALKVPRTLKKPFYLFLLVSIPARLMRFTATVLLAHFTSTTLLKDVPYKVEILSIFWIVLYTCYSFKMYRWKRRVS